ncbi:unnamed protein product [Urochloa decumbens]|uniref:Uncharacterized protein n=1 Tax=Urochloa decumbens TaxID=240449 RepID=A0ABC9B8G6_9POAL
MDPGPSRHGGGGSPKLVEPSALDDMLVDSPAPAVAVEPRPDEIPAGSGALPLAISNSNPDVIPSQVLDDDDEVVITAVRSATSASMEGAHEEKTAAVAADARIPTVQSVNDRFVPISDVKAMLLTGRFEGQRVTYRNKRTRQNLLHGVIRRTAYFCSCGDNCNHNGNALSARAFEQHALKNGKETHNPNDHIVLSSSNITLFEACRKLKEVKNEAMQEATFDDIIKRDHAAVPKWNVEAPAIINTSAVDNSNVIDIVRKMERRMESTEKRMESLQSQVNTIEKNIDFFCKEMVRYQELFQGLSKMLGKFVDDM